MDRFDEMTGESWDRVTGAKLCYKLKHTARWDAHGSKASVQRRSEPAVATTHDHWRATRIVQNFPLQASASWNHHPLISRCGRRPQSAL